MYCSSRPESYLEVLPSKDQDDLITNMRMLPQVEALNPYNFGRLVKFINFRPTSGQTSGKKNRFFYWLKRTAVKFQGLFGGRLSV